MTTDSAQQVVVAAMTALTGPKGQVDPYPHYARLRALGPAAEMPDGTLVLSGYRLCSAVLRDHRFLKHPERVLVASGYPDWREHPGLNLLFSSILVLNPPEHTRLRRLVSGAFTTRRVAGLRPAVERIVDELIERVGTATDFVEAFGFPLPVTVIGELLGIPAADRPMFQSLARDWSNLLDNLLPETVRKGDAAGVAIHDYLADLVAQRRTAPADDLISALAAPADGDEGMATEELVTMAALLLAAGFETTTGLLSNGLVALLDHPDQAALLRERPDIAPAAAEELLRYDSPVQFLTSRTTQERIEIDGRVLPGGQRVMALLGAANRDPEVFTEPDRLVLNRGGEPSLSFGGGLHYCLGAPLARLEAQIAFPALLRAFPALALGGDPVPREGLALHGHAALPIEVGPCRASDERGPGVKRQ
jgi:cytochrome P450